MGQLERYGLYVLCLVIFLILGVAIWGEPTPVQRTDSHASAGAHGAPISASEPRGDRGPTSAGAGALGAGVLGASALGADSGRGARPEDGVARRSERRDPYFGVGDGDVSERGRDAVRQAPERASPAGTSYTVRDGDSFARIAKRVLGSERHTRALQAANPGVNPRALRAGMVLRMPAPGQAAASSRPAASDPVPRRTEATTYGRSTWRCARPDRAAVLPQCQVELHREDHACQQPPYARELA